MPTVRCTGQMSRWSSSAKLAPLSPPCLPSTGDSAVVLHKMARRQSFDIDLLDVFAQSLNF